MPAGDGEDFGQLLRNILTSIGGQLSYTLEQAGVPGAEEV